MIAIKPSKLFLMSVLPQYPNIRIMRLILRVFLSSSFLDIKIFTHFFTKKMRITLFILNHRYVPFQLHHLAIMASHNFPDHLIPSLYASYQLKGLRKYVLFQLRNAPVYGKQVQVLFHPDTDWLPWSCGTYGDSIVPGNSDTLSGSELHIFLMIRSTFPTDILSL